MLLRNNQRWWTQHSYPQPWANSNGQERAMIFFEHAIYFEDGIQHVIFSDQLKEFESLILSCAKELWDKNKQYRLFPHFNGEEYVFASLLNSERVYLDYKVISHRISDKAEILRYKLSQRDNHIFVTRREKDLHPLNAVLVSTTGYIWDTFVDRDLTKDFRIQHDVFGYFPSFSSSESHPFIAIDIYEDTFPDADLFNAMIEATAAVPYMIMLDFIKPKYKHLRLDLVDNCIYPYYFIYDGSLWKGADRVESSSTDMLRHLIAEDKEQQTAVKRG